MAETRDALLWPGQGPGVSTPSPRTREQDGKDGPWLFD